METSNGPRVLSVKQPWAWAIATGRKKVENRSWTTRYRGSVYIHASTKRDREGVDFLHTKRVAVPSDLPSGVVIAVAELVDVVEGAEGRRFGFWFSGPYGLVFKNVRLLKRPVATRGKLGLFRPSPALMRAVNRQLP